MLALHLFQRKIAEINTFLIKQDAVKLQRISADPVKNFS